MLHFQVCNPATELFAFFLLVFMTPLATLAVKVLYFPHSLYQRVLNKFVTFKFQILLSWSNDIKIQKKNYIKKNSNSIMNPK